MMDVRSVKAFVKIIELSREAQNAVIPVCEEILQAFAEEYLSIKNNMENRSLFSALAQKIDQEPDIVMLAICILLGIESHDLYKEMKISDEIYWASMKEIAVWEKTCERMLGHIGLYEYGWIINFLKADIVRLHRLEFHVIQYEEETPWRKENVTVKKGDNVINIHIPEDGPLNHDDAIESYRRAYRYFGCSGLQAFVCEPWLLYPGNNDFLSEKSNIRKFMDDFDITRKQDVKCSSDLWRVFGPCKRYDDAAMLPKNTELQRNMIRYLEEHDYTTGSGFGFSSSTVKISLNDTEMDMKIVITDGFAVNPGDLNWDWLRKYGEVTVYDKISDAEAPEAVGDADIVFTNRVKIGKDVIDNCPNFKYVSALGTGYDMIDVKLCREKGVEVCNAPGYSTASVAQHAFTLLLANAYDLNGYADMVKNGKWTGIPGFRYHEAKFVELEAKTVGVYGCGAIGMRFAKICQAFGMKVLATKRSKTEGEIDGIRFVEPDVLLSESDYISFHCPLTDETRGMVNQEFIAKMKDGAVIVNTSRGAVLNESDVAQALHSGKLGGAGLDVLAKEPADPANPLLKAPNTIITPHCAWTSKEARLRLMDILDKNLDAFIETGKGINRVF